MTKLPIGFVLSLLIAGAAYRQKALSVSGAAGAILVGTITFSAGGWIWGLLLITFFFSSSLLSHHRHATKARVAEEFAKSAQRDLGQVLANGGLGAATALLYWLRPSPLLFAAFVGAIATVNADTWATEIGLLSSTKPRLVTTGCQVPPGTSGAISRLGTLAALSGALLIGLIAFLLRQLEAFSGCCFPSLADAQWLTVTAVSGLIGSTFDSFLGATVQGIYYCDQCEKETERLIHRCGRTTRLIRGWRWLNNDFVNFLSSVVGSGIAAAAVWLLT